MRLHAFNSETGSWQRRTSRRGGMSVWMILAMGVLLAALALAVDGAYLWMAKAEMRNAADSIALATAQALLRDEVLSNRPEAMWKTAQLAYQEAVRYGQANPVLGQPLELVFDAGDPESGDVIFGYRESPHDRSFQAAVDLGDVNINAVRVIARRTRQRGNPAGMFFGRVLGLPVADVVASATAYLDRDVIGFRPVGNRSIPLAPIALLSDPTQGKSLAWETQTLGPLQEGASDAADRFTFDPVHRRFVELDAGPEPGDGIYEMEVRLPLGQPTEPGEGHEEEFNACFVVIGHDANSSESVWSTLVRQFKQGITAQDLAEMGGQIVLGEDNRVVLAGMPFGPLTEEIAGDSLFQVLDGLRQSGEPRIWPLYSTVARNRDGATGWQVTIQGFVAARVVQVEKTPEAGSGGAAQPMLSFVLQPCQMAVNAAVTDSDRRYANPAFSIYNRYIAKVRLVNE